MTRHLHAIQVKLMRKEVNCFKHIRQMSGTWIPVMEVYSVWQALAWMTKLVGLVSREGAGSRTDVHAGMLFYELC